MHTTVYRDTLVTVSADCPVPVGTIPDRPHTVAGMQHTMLSTAPYTLTSDDLLFAVHAERHPGTEREAFFAKPQACLRASPLVKSFGWGIHHDAEGRVALIPRESVDYQRLLDDPAVKKTPGMRSRRR